MSEGGQGRQADGTRFSDLGRGDLFRFTSVGIVEGTWRVDWEIGPRRCTYGKATNIETGETRSVHVWMAVEKVTVKGLRA